MGDRLWVAKIRQLIPLMYQMRKGRFTLFMDLIAALPRPLRILDVGGTPSFWEAMGVPKGDVSITLLNVDHAEAVHRQIHTLVGDARDMASFESGAFDVVFSNSLIEHVGSFQDQQRAAEEIRRVGRRYFIQTPNRYFPVEPHFLIPFFQFLPLSLKVFLLRRFNVGWYRRFDDEQQARAIASSIRLLTRRELKMLFPDGQILGEKILGMTYSLIVHGGWDKGGPGPPEEEI